MADDETALKKALQTEVMGVKTRWADAIKLSKAKPDAPNAPLPIGVQRTIERPDDAYAYDVEELKVRLCINALDSTTLPVHVEVTASVPTTLSDKMNGHIEKRWKAELQARGAGKGWLLEKILAWCESAYVELVTLEPTFVEMYEGCDDNGMTIRRYAITEPPEPKEESSEESEESEEEVGAARAPACPVTPSARLCTLSGFHRPRLSARSRALVGRRRRRRGSSQRRRSRRCAS